MLSCGATSAHAIAALCWRITRHNTLAALADLYPQWLVRDLLPLPPSGGIPREATRSLNPPSSASLRANAAGRSLRRSQIAIKAAMVAGVETAQEITMAQIGTFIRMRPARSMHRQCPRPHFAVRQVVARFRKTPIQEDLGMTVTTRRRNVSHAPG